MTNFYSRGGLIIGAWMLMSCAGGPEQEREFVGRYVFDVYEENHTWNYTLRGFYIDDQGGVYQYDHGDDRWVPGTQRGGRLSEMDLAEKFQNAKLVDNVGAAVLEEKARLIPAALKGGLSKLNAASDRGRFAYTGLIYDSETQTYRVILLGAEGDWLETNAAPAAKQLMEWLKDVKYTVAEKQQR